MFGTGYAEIEILGGAYCVVTVMEAETLKVFEKYVYVAVMVAVPLEIPLTTPPAVTVATLAFELVQALKLVMFEVPFE